MWNEILTETGKSLWKEIGRDALKKGVSTVVVETIRAGIDIVKRKKIRKDDYAFQQWKKEQEPDEEKAETDDKAEGSEDNDESKKPDPEPEEGKAPEHPDPVKTPTPES